MGIKKVVAEEWRPIEDFPGYEISRQGYIRVAETGEKLDLTHDGKGKRLVWLYDKRGRLDLRVVGNLWEKAFVLDEKGVYGR